MRISDWSSDVCSSDLLIVLRLLQGLALGGEYGGAATYVAEHAPQNRRGFHTGWIQTTATMGLFLSLLVILGIRSSLSEEAFMDWGWRIPFLISVRSEEHTSELQSLMRISYAVFCLKKKKHS